MKLSSANQCRSVTQRNSSRSWRGRCTMRMSTASCIAISNRETFCSMQRANRISPISGWPGWSRQRARSRGRWKFWAPQVTWRRNKLSVIRRRYASALALAEDVERWLKHEPIRARRTGLVTRGRKWVRRNPSIAVMAAMLLVLAVPLGVMIWRTESERSTASNAAPPEKSIAVLPFSNLSKEQENAFFTDGVQDEILSDLAKVADLKVISRTSVMPYKSAMARNVRQIGQQLNVAHVVEGSVQRTGNRVRVHAQLFDARTDRHLWAQTYDRDMA